MKLTLKGVLQLDSLKNAQLLVGEDKLDELVNDIMVMERPDVEHWMTKNQLIITSLYSFYEDDSENFDIFVKKVRDYHGAGIIVKVGPKVENVPAELIEACREWEVPLISIPENTQYRDIIAEVTEYLLYAKRNEVDYYYQFHHEFLNLLRSPHVEIKDIVKLLSKLLDLPVLLLDKKKVIFSTNPYLIDFEVLDEEDFPYNKHFDFKRKLVYFPAIDKKHHVISTVAYTDSNHSYEIVVVETTSEVDLREVVVIENACHQVQIQGVNNRNIDIIKHSMKLDLLDIVLFHTTNNRHEIEEAIEQLHLNPDLKYRLLVMAHNLDVKEEEIENLFEQLLLPDFPQNMAKITSTMVIVIFPVLNEEDLDNKTVKNKLINNLKELNDECVQRVFITNPTDLMSLPEEIQKVRTFRSMLENSNQELQFVIEEDLFVYKMIQQFGDDQELLHLVPKDLFELYEDNYDLYTTLRSYLKNSLNTKRTAEELYVHPKTVTYRLNRITELSGINFDDGESLLNYNMGIKIVDYISPKKKNN